VALHGGLEKGLYQAKDLTSGTTCSSIFADIKTLGTPAPGWLLAPTK
jgi:hypothetical protein